MELAKRLPLAWSYYVTLLTIDNPESASRLQRIEIQGSSVIRLKLYRRFYQKQKEIGPTVSDQLASLASVDGTPAIRPTASDESIPIDNPEEYRFYEIEAEAVEVQYL